MFANATDILFTGSLLLLGLASPYKNFLVWLFCCVLFLSIYKYVLISRYQCYREYYRPISSIVSSIKSGDLISTYSPSYSTTISGLSLARVVVSDSYLHNLVAVEYQNNIWVVNALSEDYYDTASKAASYRANLKYLFGYDRWHLFMLPIEDFLRIETDYGSILRVCHTNSPITFRQSDIDELERRIRRRTFTQSLHCCEFLGKYLSILGKIHNHTALHDSLYFCPRTIARDDYPRDIFSLTDC